MKWFRRHSIEGKPILVTLAASVISVIVACTLFIVYDIDNFRRAMKEDLIVVAEGIAINSTPALEFESLDSARDILGALRADPHIETAVIYDRKGNSVDYRRADLDAAVVPALSHEEGAWFEDGKLRIYKFVLREGKILGTIFIQSDMRKLSDRLRSHASVVVIVALASVLAALLVTSQLPKLDILGLSSSEAGKMAPHLETFDVKALVDDVKSTIHPLIERNANVLEVHCPPETGAMHADMTLVRQVLFNLLSTASGFTERGTIALHVSRDESADGDWMTFRVIGGREAAVFVVSLPARTDGQNRDGLRISSAESTTGRMAEPSARG